MTTRRQFLKNSLITASSLTMSSCGWRLADVKPSKNPSSATDVLYIYTWAGYTDDDLLNRFQETTGIKAIADVYDSNEAMLARIQASGGGAYSIIYPSDYMVQEMADLKLLRELDHSKIVGLERLLPQFQNPGYDLGNKYSVCVSWGTTGLIYNPQKVSNKPTDWSFLWENADKIKKRFSLLNDMREVMGATLRMLGYSYNSTDLNQIQAAYNKLMELKPAIASFDSDAWKTQILSSDYLLAMCYSSDASVIMEENPDLQYIIPTSGSSLWADTLVIPRSAPNVEAAYAWINFMLQPDVAATLTERLSFATPNQEALSLIPENVKSKLFPPETVIKNCEGIKPLGDKISEIYDRYWTKLTSS